MEASLPVLVPEAEERYSVAVIRSLGRAGYVVHACSARRYAMGWGSRFATHATRCPEYGSDEFLPWLRDYCARHAIRCIVPTEALLLTIREVHAEFAPLLPMSSDPLRVYASISKYELFRQLLEDPGSTVSANSPPMLLLTANDPIPDEPELAALGLPLYVKWDAVHARTNRLGGGTDKAATACDAQQRVRDRLATHDRLVVQGSVPGVGIGAFLLRWNGKVLARFMHRRLHELPGSGHSSYRMSWWHPEIMADAEAKLEHLGFSGVAMMEYRWDPVTGAFRLLEMNARFWGSLHLALYSGVDFPRLLVDAFFDRPAETAPAAKPAVRCRNFMLDVRYLWSRLRAADVSWIEKLWALPKFVWLSLNPNIKSDLWYPGDRRLWWLQFRQYLTRFAPVRRS